MSKANTIDKFLRRLQIKLNIEFSRLIIFFSSIKFDRKNFNIKLCDYNNNNVFELIKNELFILIINENKFVTNLINEKNNFLIDKNNNN